VQIVLHGPGAARLAALLELSDLPERLRNFVADELERGPPASDDAQALRTRSSVRSVVSEEGPLESPHLQVPPEVAELARVQRPLFGGPTASQVRDVYFLGADDADAADRLDRGERVYQRPSPGFPGPSRHWVVLRCTDGRPRITSSLLEFYELVGSAPGLRPSEGTISRAIRSDAELRAYCAGAGISYLLPR
jgi:hypothetical protein